MQVACVISSWTDIRSMAQMKSFKGEIQSSPQCQSVTGENLQINLLSSTINSLKAAFSLPSGREKNPEVGMQDF